MPKFRLKLFYVEECVADVLENNYMQSNAKLEDVSLKVRIEDDAQILPQ